MIDLTGYKLTFDDEFDASSISQNGVGTTWSDIRPQWRYDAESDIGFGHSSFLDAGSGYNPFSVSGGALTITAEPNPTSYGYPGSWASGLISTQNSFSQTYGYFEMRAQVSAAPGSWDAFWMLPDKPTPAPSGASGWQELDVVEHYGGNPNGVYSTIHTIDQTPDIPWQQNRQVYSETSGLTTGYHTYGMDWEPDRITFYVDGNVMGSQATPSDMHSPMYLLADLATQNGASGPMSTKIDYIRAFSKDPTAAAIAQGVVSAPDGQDPGLYGATATTPAAPPVMAVPTVPAASASADPTAASAVADPAASPTPTPADAGSAPVSLPAAPAITDPTAASAGTAPAVSITGVSGATNVVDHVVSGTVDAADAGSVVTVMNGSTALGTAMSDANGTWSLPFVYTGDGSSYIYGLTASDMNAAGTGTSPATALALNFVPNETSFGTISHDASQPGGEIYALYEGLLGRAPDAQGAEGWVASLNGGASIAQVTQSFLDSPEGQQTFQSGSSNKSFVDALYQKVLGRAPDAGGEQGWIGDLNAGGSRADVADGFVFSAEHVSQLQPALKAGVYVADANTSAVARLYYGLLGRAPDAGGLSSNTQAVDGGASIQTEAQNFLNSSEYQAKSSGLTNDQFVTALYENALGRAPEQSGLQAWDNQLAAGASRSSVAVGIIQSQEGQSHLAGRIETGFHLA